MSKLKTATINEAPNYIIAQDGVVINKKTETPVSEKNGSVRLTVNGNRKTFKVQNLVDKYFSETENESKEKKKSSPKPKQDNGGKKDKEFYDKVRSDYDKDPENFNVTKYAKKAGVSYGRIWSIVKLHKKNKDANKN